MNFLTYLLSEHLYNVSTYVKFIISIPNLLFICLLKAITMHTELCSCQFHALCIVVLIHYLHSVINLYFYVQDIGQLLNNKGNHAIARNWQPLKYRLGCILHVCVCVCVRTCVCVHACVRVCVTQFAKIQHDGTYQNLQYKAL